MPRAKKAVKPQSNVIAFPSARPVILAEITPPEKIDFQEFLLAPINKPAFCKYRDGYALIDQSTNRVVWRITPSSEVF